MPEIVYIEWVIKIYSHFMTKLYDWIYNLVTGNPDTFSD